MQMAKNNNPVKLILCAFFVFISCNFILYAYIQLTASNLYYKSLIIALLFVIGIFVQYVLALARALWLKNKPEKNKYINPFKCKAVLLFMIFGFYILAFEILSGIGFFISEVKVSEEIVLSQETARNMQLVYLDQLSNTISGLNDGLKQEVKTGYGENSREVLSNIMQFMEDQRTSIKSFEKVPGSPGNSPAVIKNVFKNLSEVLPLPESRIKLLMFGAVMLMMILGLILTNPDIEIEDKKMPAAEPKITADLTSSLRNYLLTNKEKIIKYISEMTEDNSVKLKKDEIISEKTGIPVAECQVIRLILKNTKQDGKPFIYISQGKLPEINGFTRDKIIENIKGLM